MGKWLFLAGILGDAFIGAPIRAVRRWLYTPPPVSCGTHPGIPTADPDNQP